MFKGKVQRSSNICPCESLAINCGNSELFTLYYDHDKFLFQVGALESMASYQLKPSRVSSPIFSRSGSSSIEEHSGGFLTDSPADSVRITRMKTRVAVRDKTPHRFQVVPLRDVQPEIPQWSASSNSKNNAQRNPSGKLGPYSQSRQFPPSCSIQPTLVVPRKTDSGELDGTIWELNVNSTLATTLYNKPLTASVAPSPKLLHEVSKPDLAEWDMNQERPIPRLTHVITPTEPKSPPYQGAMNASIRTELTPTHTTSQSLRITSLPNRNYPKFASLSQRSIDILDMLPATPFSGFENDNLGVEAEYRNLAKAVIPIKEETDFSEVNNFLLPNDNQQPLRAKSRRRHAIYTESLYVPYLDEGCNSHSQESTPKSSRICSSNSYTELAQATRTNNPEFANASCLKPRLVANQAPSAFTAISTDLLTSNRATLATSRTRSATRGLYYPVDKPSRGRILSGEDISHSEIVYPCIVLELFAEINLAIEQWKPIL
jgi:hypothetical protein